MTSHKLQRYSNKIQAVGRKGDHTWAIFDPVARRIKTSVALDPPICPEEAQYLDDLSKWWKLINPDVILPTNTGGRKTVTLSQMQEKVFCNLVAEVGSLIVYSRFLIPLGTFCRRFASSRCFGNACDRLYAK